MKTNSTPCASSSPMNAAGSFLSLKDPLTFDEQYNHLLGEYNLSLETWHKQEIIECLSRINYYRLSGYWLTFKQDDNKFVSGTALEDIMMIVCFDSELRQLLFVMIELIEVKFKTQLAYQLAIKYRNSMPLTDPSVLKEECRDKTIEEIKRQIRQAKNNHVTYVKHNLNTYHNLPIWVLVEVLSLGCVSKIYANLSNDLVKRKIAQAFLLDTSSLKSWIEHITYVRNICAHYGRVYNVLIKKKAKIPKDIKKDVQENEFDNNYIFYTFYILLYLYAKNEGFLAKEYLSRLKAIIEQYPKVNLAPCGFPDDWLDILNKVVNK